MNFNDSILNIMEWHEKIIDINNGSKFMLYFNDFLNEEFGKIIKRYEKFNIEYESHEITVSIFYDKFIARVEGKEVRFYKQPFPSKELDLLGVYSLSGYVIKSHKLFDKNLREFHPDYITLMLEDAFSGLNRINEDIKQRVYWLT